MLFLKMISPLIIFFIALIKDIFGSSLKQIKWLKYLLIILMIVALFISLTSTYTDDEKKSNQNLILENKNKEYLLKIDSLIMLSKGSDNKIDELNHKLDPFIELALKRYPHRDSSSALNKLYLELQQVQKENEAIKGALKQQINSIFRLVSKDDGSIAYVTPYQALMQKYYDSQKEYQSGNIESARFMLEVVLEKEPNFPKALIFLGFIYNELGMTDKTLELLNKAENLTKDGQDLNNIALIKSNLGKKMNLHVIDNN